MGAVRTKGVRLRLFKVQGIYYADLRLGRRRRQSTRCTDRKAAELIARQWERDAADPDYATTSQATLSDVELPRFGGQIRLLESE
ncbi:MAG: hypothetical protein JWN04_6329 [Myxococcaceae bacterium]|nr:hypothetical protein [Myxococcaceae bacterium]